MVKNIEAERAARGAALLDAERPGWAAGIKTDDLNMASARCCIIGQLYGDYGYALDDLGISGFRFRAWRFVYRATDLGFTRDYRFDCSRDEWDRLRLAWLTEIARRLPAGSPKADMGDEPYEVACEAEAEREKLCSCP